MKYGLCSAFSIRNRICMQQLIEFIGNNHIDVIGRDERDAYEFQNESKLNSI